MKPRALPSYELLHELLRYDATTGLLYWRERNITHFKREQDKLMWNTRFANKEALASIDDDGYRRGTLLYKSCLAHRVIYKMLHNDEPDQVDHDDRDRLNNRPHNLVGTDAQGNSRNSKLYDNNTSGHTGVVWDSHRKKWAANIKVDGVVTFLGRFDDKQGAIDARLAAEKRHNFHPNHGK